ncbi:MAG: DUF4836 family protein [Muribaculaceae bacterium]|nr:DUF4836 family protein [Muribaculaceae bacterium]
MKSSRVLTFVITLLLLASCSSVNDNLEKMIPADALGVVSINVPDILKKTGINDDGNLVIPEAIKPVIDENDASTLSTLVTDLPYMGLNTGSKAFAFFTNKTFGAVILATLDDEAAARKTIERRTGGDFQQVEGLNCIYREDNLYVINDKVLLIATVNKAMDINKAAKQAGTILNKQRQSILDNEQVKQVINADGDINAYLQQDGLKLILKKNKTYREIAQKLPLVEIFTESDAKAYECHLNLNEQSADLTTRVFADENSDYNKLLTTTLAKADPSFLKAIPNSMDYIVTMSVKGDNFVKLQQIQQLIGMFKKLPFIGRIDLQGILASIDGPIAIGLARDPHLEGEWNAVIAAKTTNPDMILNQISSFASSMGQAPEIYDGEYIYQYENKMIKLGVVDGVLYLKMLDYEQTEGYAYELESVRALFEASNVGLYINPQVTQGGTFTYGMSDNFNGKGQFIPTEKGAHAAQTLLKVLCAIKPPQAYDDMLDDDEEITTAFGTPIDQLKPVE